MRHGEHRPRSCCVLCHALLVAENPVESHNYRSPYRMSSVAEKRVSGVMQWYSFAERRYSPQPKVVRIPRWMR